MDRIQTANKQVDKFGAGKHGFSAGNPAGGVLATAMSNTWCDGVQEEPISVIEAAGIVPSSATNNQLLQALRSAGVFTTAAQFDNTTKAATTAFVQRALGNFQGVVSPSSATALTAAQSGSLVLCSGTGYTVTLPAPNSQLTYTLYSTATNSAITISTPSGGIYVGGTSAGSTFVIPSNSTIQLISDGTNWIIGLQGLGQASLAVNGFQKLPSGLILQWGAASTSGASATVTFPVAYTTQIYVALATYSGGSAAYFGTQILSATQMTVTGPSVNQTFNWLTIGK